MGFQRSMHGFRRDCSVRIYLFKIARNQLLYAIRTRVRDKARFNPSETTMADVAPSATVLLAASDDQKLLVAALRSLPIDVQIMLELHYWEQLKVAEVAEVLGMNVNTVKARMRRGRQRLEVEIERLAESAEQLNDATVTGRGDDAVPRSGLSLRNRLACGPSSSAKGPRGPAMVSTTASRRRTRATSQTDNGALWKGRGWRLLKLGLRTT